MSVAEYRAGTHRIALVPESNRLSDTRGVIWMFEEPNPRASYVVGVDVAEGIPGWSRFSRTDNDNKVDNSAIEVFRTAQEKLPSGEVRRIDIQVAEFTAPINGLEVARVANMLGRLYAGNNEDNQALMIIEVYPGPGGPCQVELMDKYGYSNLYRSQQLDTGSQTVRKYQYGWTSNAQSMPHLWTKGLSLIHQRAAIIKSPDLIEEFADCEMDTMRGRGAAKSGNHDDRVTACLLALWASRRWSFTFEPDTTTKVEAGPQPNWQARDVTSAKMMDLWEEMFDRMGDTN